jgi:hypothetical protein
MVTQVGAITYAMKPIGSCAKSITQRTGVGICGPANRAAVGTVASLIASAH